jgi:putative membrane protein
MNITRKYAISSLLAATFALTLGSGLASAQSPNDMPSDGPPPPAQSTQPQPDPDRGMRHNHSEASAVTDSQFASAAAMGGMAEVKLGQLAQDKSTNDAVKAFGKRMFEDHTKAGDDLKAAAVKSNINLPSDISARDQATYDRLAKLSGSAFDQAYARNMVRDHVHDVAAFKNESANGTDPNIKSFATDTLPTLQEHLKAARQMAQAVGVQVGPGSGGRGPNPPDAPNPNPDLPPPPGSQQQ